MRYAGERRRAQKGGAGSLCGDGYPPSRPAANGYPIWGQVAHRGTGFPCAVEFNCEFKIVSTVWTSGSNLDAWLDCNITLAFGCFETGQVCHTETIEAIGEINIDAEYQGLKTAAFEYGCIILPIQQWNPVASIIATAWQQVETLALVAAGIFSAQGRQAGSSGNERLLVRQQQGADRLAQ
jgi:hypothetical protein